MDQHGKPKAKLEIVLGATPRGFKSRILRQQFRALGAARPVRLVTALVGTLVGTAASWVHTPGMTTGEWRQARVGTPHLSPVAELAHRAAATLAIWFAVLGGALTAWPLAAVAVVLGTGTCAVRVRPSAAVAVVLGAAITCWLLMIARDPTATITLP